MIMHFFKCCYCVIKQSPGIAGPPQSLWPSRRTEKGQISMSTGAWQGMYCYHHGLGEEYHCFVPYLRCILFYFFGRSFSLFVNHSPISFHKHVHASGLLNEGCSIICCVAAHTGTGVFILISAICYEWGRLLRVPNFWSWFPSWLIKGYFSSAICSTQCNKHFSVVHFCLKKNQSFANMHCLGNVMHSGFDPVPFLSHSCFWYGRESSPIV